ncbi:hypothetical protein ABEW00_03195 [Rossellomorea vietnamensis]|uniref:hypothetical protein n=1 Tax=Rossellomorea vietnamensis TaxID=218284 RepID=UPI003D2DDFE9
MINILSKKIILKKEYFHKHKEIYEFFQNFSSSISNEDLSKFMTLQHYCEENPFYIEQIRWFEELVLQKKQGFSFSFRIASLESRNSKESILGINVKVTRPSGRTKILKGEFVIFKKNKEWKINDFPFKVIQSDVCSLYYLDGNEDLAQIAFEYTQKITSYLEEIFNWKPTGVNLKFYTTLEQLSFTIPWFATYGWHEQRESIKIALPYYVKNKEHSLFSMLLHEISHKMLSDLSNDNASLYLQEGLAILLEKGHYIKEGKIYFSEESLYVFHLEVLDNIKVNLNISLDELNKLTYNDGEMLYFYGFLLAYYLFKEWGFKIFSSIGNNLSKKNYINARAHTKNVELNKITSVALKQLLPINSKFLTLTSFISEQ